MPDTHYRRLVRLAYLVLPGDLEPEDRLAAAHRIVHRAAPQELTDETYPAARDRVLRRALRGPGRRRARLGPWLRARPAAPRDDDLRLTGGLAALTPGQRAAFVLRHVEELPPEATHVRLSTLGVPDPAGALAAADALGGEQPAQDAATRFARPPLDPTIARLSAAPRRSRLPLGLGAVAAALVVLAGLAVATGGLGGDGARTAFGDTRLERPATVAAGTWRRTTRLDLHAWNPRGAGTGDAELTGAAVRAWRADPGGPPAERPSLLYAGELDGRRIVLLHDGRRVARRTGARLETFPAGRTLPGGASPLELAPGRYLVPPWVTGVRTAELAGTARWRTVPVRGGVTAPIPAAGGRCWRGPVLQLRQPEIAHGRPYTMTDLGALTSANLLYQPPPPAPVRRLGPHQIDGEPEARPEGFALWARLGCTAAAPTTLRERADVESATAFEFWAGRLPDGGGTGRWVCVRYAFTDGGSAVRAVLLDARGGTVTGARSGTWDCSRLARDVASGAWWRSPQGRWHYLAAGSRRVTVLAARGPFARPAVAGGLLTARGPVAVRPPAGAVTLTARAGGEAVPVLQ
ncbi:hypothetical protein [Actinomadura flavalba]|uniref:hypothetical protein n=1 Tax=Actinomadura flavalba TaxID=1120938 RepID=UPI000369B940|nr:hypothetical protein [Actinomadura flavalba]